MEIKKKKKSTLCSVRNPENMLSHSLMLSGKDFYESKFLHLLIPREILMSQPMSGPGSPG